MRKKEVVIGNVVKKYDNPVAELVQAACRFSGSVVLVNGTFHINAKSMMGVMAFNPAEGKTVLIETNGPDEAEALEAIDRFLRCE